MVGITNEPDLNGVARVILVESQTLDAQSIDSAITSSLDLDMFSLTGSWKLN